MPNKHSPLYVFTDLFDYAPGDTAVFTVEGVDKGGSIEFEVQHVSDPGEDGVYGTADDVTVDLGGDGHDSWVVVDGGEGDLDGKKNGTIVTEWYVNPDDSLDETFLLTATDLSNGEVASTSFTDALTNTPTVDLTGATPTQGEINGAIFSSDAVGAGSGVIDSFVRLSTNQDVEEGFNTSDRPLKFDENKSPTFTRDLQLKDIPIIYIGDIAYAEFQLDINEPADGASEYLSLDEVKIYWSANQIDTSGIMMPSDLSSQAMIVYDMDEFGDEWVGLNYVLQSGSGVSDMIMYVPLDDFKNAGADQNSYITLYSKFGVQETETDAVSGITYEWINNSGFEEWAVREFIMKSGYKFHDLNANGIWDEGESGLAGWTIYIDEDGDNEFDEGVEMSVVTDDTGYYQFSLFEDGTYTFREVLQDGWYQSAPEGDEYTESLKSGDRSTDNNFGNYQLASISGVKYHDLNADGTRQAGNGEGGLEGWRIYVDANGNNQYDPGEAYDDTDSDGNWEITGLAPGTYTVREVLQTDWFNSDPGGAPAAQEISVTVTSGENDSGHEFGNYTTGSISGVKYHDLNADGDRDADGVDNTPGNADDEAGLQGWAIRAYADDGDGVLSQAEYNAGPAGSATTTSTGAYTISGLAPGDYVVVEVVQNNWNESPDNGTTETNANDIDSSLSDYGYKVNLSSQESETGKDFGNYQTASITGEKYNDLDADGSTGTDTPIENWKVYLFDAADIDDGDGVLSDTELAAAIDGGNYAAAIDDTSTDVSGVYSFAGLTPGKYFVIEEQPEGWTSYSTPWVFADLQSGEEFGDDDGVEGGVSDFYNYTTGSISGIKYHDVNGNGAYDSGTEALLAGWTILAFADDGDGLLSQDEYNAGAVDSAQTGADGSYTISGLAPGYYIVVEEVQNGWFATPDLDTDPTGANGWDPTLSDDGYAVNLDSQESATGKDFGNQMIPPPPPTDTEGRAQTPGFWKNWIDKFDRELYQYDRDFDPEDIFDFGNPDPDPPSPYELASEQDYEDVFGVTLYVENGADITLYDALGAMGGHELALLRSSTAALANAASDDLVYIVDEDSFLVGIAEVFGLDLEEIEGDDMEAFDMYLAKYMPIAELIDNDGNGTISAEEVVNAVQDLYSPDGSFATLLGTNGFDFDGDDVSILEDPDGYPEDGGVDVDELALAFDILNNMEHEEAVEVA